MLELLAAIAGAVVGVAGARWSASASRQVDARDAVVRLTEAVEHIARQLEVLHEDIKADRRETYSRIGSVEQRVSKLEGRG